MSIRTIFDFQIAKYNKKLCCQYKLPPFATKISESIHNSFQNNYVVVVSPNNWYSCKYSPFLLVLPISFDIVIKSVSGCYSPEAENP